jgi:hypothetical protein
MTTIVWRGLMLAFGSAAVACFIGAAVIDERIELDVASTPKEMNLGEVDSDTSHRCEFVLTNNGRVKAHLSETRSTCGCTVGETSRQKLSPGEEAQLHVSVKAGNDSGTVVRTVYVEVANEEATLRNVIAVPIRLTVRSKR